MGRQKSLDEMIADLNRVTRLACKTFGRYGIFISEDTGFPSYASIQGAHPCPIPDGTPVSIGRWPIQNGRPKDIANALHGCEKLGRTILASSRGQDLRVLSREYMIEGTTLPIRVLFELSGELRDGIDPIAIMPGERNISAVYVKQMHLNRIFLGSLYHVAVGRDFGMRFSESSVVELESSGPTLLEAYRRDPRFLSNPHWRKELVRMGTVAYFLSLYDLDNGANTVVTKRGRFDVIDFDKGFWDPVRSPEAELLNPFSYVVDKGEGFELYGVPQEKLLRHFSGGEIRSEVQAEMGRIYRRIKANAEFFNDVVEAMSHVEYYNSAARELHGVRDVREYFTRRLEEFRVRGTT